MAIVFDFESEKDFHFAKAFAKRFDRQEANDRVVLPETMGTGFIQEVFPGNGLSLCLHHYTLKEELILRRLESGANDVLTIKFSGRRKKVQNDEEPKAGLMQGKGYEVEFGTGNFFTVLKLPPNEEINFLVIVTTRRTLLDLLKPGPESAVIAGTILNNPSFVLHEGMTGEIERTLKQLNLINEKTELPVLLYQIKAQELLYLFFTRLFARKEGASMAVNREDVDKIYALRTTILNDLSAPPQLPELSRNIGMSATKMKQLFRQIFGDSIYNYYQAARMNEAAQLLARLSVSEAGYRVGFSNLSHFSRLFEKFHQMKPKRYKDSLGKANPPLVSSR